MLRREIKKMNEKATFSLLFIPTQSKREEEEED
jgi:hypothetical protein